MMAVDGSTAVAGGAAAAVLVAVGAVLNGATKFVQQLWRMRRDRTAGNQTQKVSYIEVTQEAFVALNKAQAEDLSAQRALVRDLQAQLERASEIIRTQGIKIAELLETVEEQQERLERLERSNGAT